MRAGARPVDVGQSADSSWTALADPGGNEFCILSRSVRDVLAVSGHAGEASSGEPVAQLRAGEQALDEGEPAGPAVARASARVP